MSKLWKVCDIVRAHLGLDHLHFCYQAPRHCLDDSAAAITHIFPQNHAGIIVFYKPFFLTYPAAQLEVIVHEHMHVALMPLDQLIRKNKFTNLILEHTLDALVPSLCQLLKPKLRTVWSCRQQLKKPRTYYAP